MERICSMLGRDGLRTAYIISEKQKRPLGRLAVDGSIRLKMIGCMYSIIDYSVCCSFNIVTYI
jgi:hypothetical protein